MPKQGQSVESCILTEMKKKKGDTVAVGDILFAYETDKASFEEEAQVAGTVLDVFFDNGDEIPVLTNVMVIGNEGESTDEFRPGGAAPAAEAAAPAAAATAAPSASSMPRSALENPRKISERMTPELPRAPRSRAEAQREAASSTVQFSGSTAISLAAAPIVILILVPVSPSGTGKMFSASTAWRLLAMLFEPEMTPSRNISPVIIM